MTTHTCMTRGIDGHSIGVVGTESDVEEITTSESHTMDLLLYLLKV